MWDFEDGNPLVTSKNPTWPLFGEGERTVTLIASNCAGSDTFRKVINLRTPTSPFVNFTVDNVNPTTNDIAYFTSNIEQCVDVYE